MPPAFALSQDQTLRFIKPNNPRNLSTRNHQAIRSTKGRVQSKPMIQNQTGIQTIQAIKPRQENSTKYIKDVPSSIQPKPIPKQPRSSQPRTISPVPTASSQPARNHQTQTSNLNQPKPKPGNQPRQNTRKLQPGHSRNPTNAHDKTPPTYPFHTDALVKEQNELRTNDGPQTRGAIDVHRLVSGQVPNGTSDKYTDGAGSRQPRFNLVGSRDLGSSSMVVNHESRSFHTAGSRHLRILQRACRQSCDQLLEIGDGPLQPLLQVNLWRPSQQLLGLADVRLALLGIILRQGPVDDP